MSIKNRTLLLPMIMAALVFFFFAPAQESLRLHAAQGVSSTPQGSPANNNLQTTDANGARIKCADIPEAKGGVLLGRIVPCLIRTIGDSTQKFSAQMIQALKPLFYSFLVFVVTMFGVKVLQGGQDLHQQAFVLVLKITLVLMILDQIPKTLIPSIYGIMSESQAIVTTTIGPDNSSISCDISKYMDENTPLIWAQMDCVLGKLYGFTTGSATKSDLNGAKSHNMFLAASMIGLAGGFFFSGTLGITIFLACIGVLLSVFLMVMRVALSFVNSYLLVCVLLIIAPLFLPLVFMRITNNYFDKWWQSILGGMLMPVLVTAYTMFALLLYDKMLFAPDALVNQLFNYDLVKKSQNPPQAMCGRPVTGNMNWASGAGVAGGVLQRMLDPMTRNVPNAEVSGANNTCASLRSHVLDVDRAAREARAVNPNAPTAAIDFIKFIFNDCLKLVILAFLITEGTKTVMNSVRLLTGTQATAGLMNTDPGLQSRLDAAKQGAMQAMGRADATNAAGQTIVGGGAAKNYTGADFLGRLGPTMTNAIQRGFSDRQ